jgi:hypothetical protein
VEWSGWQGCKSAGQIFADPKIKRVVEQLFVPCAFNTWDRGNERFNEPMKRWAGRLESSWWGYLRIVDCEGNNVINGTNQLTGYHNYNEVRDVIKASLKKLHIGIPEYFQ